jgi:hypothetical protein
MACITYLGHLSHGFLHDLCLVRQSFLLLLKRESGFREVKASFTSKVALVEHKLGELRAQPTGESWLCLRDHRMEAGQRSHRYRGSPPPLLYHLYPRLSKI